MPRAPGPRSIEGSTTSKPGPGTRPTRPARSRGKPSARPSICAPPHSERHRCDQLTLWCGGLVRVARRAAAADSARRFLRSARVPQNGDARHGGEHRRREHRDLRGREGALVRKRLSRDEQRHREADARERARANRADATSTRSASTAQPIRTASTQASTRPSGLPMNNPQTIASISGSCPPSTSALSATPAFASAKSGNTA